MPFFSNLFGMAPAQPALGGWAGAACTSTATGGSFTSQAAAQTFISTCSGNQTFTSTTYGMGGTGGICNPYTSAISSTFVGVLEIDEEDYVNNQEYFELARQRGIAFRVRTAEEKRLKEEAAERARAEAERRERVRVEAQSRARELLVAHLTPEQRISFEKNRWFIVVGGKTKTKYRIRTDGGVAGNIEVLSWGKKIATLCCHCSHDIPAADQFLAQKISLTWDEENFLRTANRRAA
jgi:hypothetical protein